MAEQPVLNNIVATGYLESSIRDNPDSVKPKE